MRDARKPGRGHHLRHPLPRAGLRGHATRITVLRNGDSGGRIPDRRAAAGRSWSAKMMGKELRRPRRHGAAKGCRGANERLPCRAARPRASATSRGRATLRSPHRARARSSASPGLLGSGPQRDRARHLRRRPISGGRGRRQGGGRTRRSRQPIDAMNSGIGHLPEDRKTEGIIADLSVRENIILALQAKRGMLQAISRAERGEDRGRVHQDARRSRPAASSDPSSPVGRQPAEGHPRPLAADATRDFLILDEPTRGIDVGTKAEIQKLVLQLAEEGVSVHLHLVRRSRRCCARCNRMAGRHAGPGDSVGELSGGGDLTQAAVMRT